jgi:hypothetical protein
VPQERREEFGGVDRVHFTAASPRGASEQTLATAIPPLTPDAPLFGQLVNQLRQMGPWVPATPARQPTSVHQIASCIFGAYQIDDGHIHLRGCTLEDRPILRLTCRLTERQQLVHCFAFPDGTPVDPDLQRRLHLDRLEPIIGKGPPRLANQVARRWRSAAERWVIQWLGPEAELLVATLIWCKFAEGKMAAVIGDQSVEVPFSGWAQLIADGHTRPPPYQCPHSGRQSRHLAATDDGRITTIDAIGVCQESGRRVIDSDLVDCSVTGRRVLSEYLAKCPVNGRHVLRTQMQVCAMCGQTVSPSTIRGGRCSGCRRLQRVSKDDPRMARVLGEHPGLDSWRRWRLSEGDAVYILVATAIWRRLLVVVDKETLDAVQLATSTRPWPGWTAIPVPQLSDHLR